MLPPNRRRFLRSLFGSSLLMPGVLSELLAEDAGEALQPRRPPFPARAKNVVFLYMSGGVSHMDTFDPKPKLKVDAANPKNRLLAPLWDGQPGGRCGTEVSDLFPHVRECMDDICLIRSMHGDHGDHFQATLGIHTGSVTVARPSLGSWVSYGLGSLNQNLPSFVVLAPELPYAGSQLWGSDFLPGCHQGTRVLSGREPIPDLIPQPDGAGLQELELGLLARLNQKHQIDRPDEPALAARLKSFETAFGMQSAMPQVLDLARESDATLALYGIERGQTRGFGWQCLVARRMIERGVRFVELIDTGAHNNWDSHSDMRAHEPLARNVNRPIAGLLRDLKSRGMLDETLVVWTTEFGRTPGPDSPKGRSHFAKAYSSWLAGGGVTGGQVIGKTDDHGANIIEDPVHVHDFHATILSLLGFDHERLTYRFAGRDFRLTDVAGKVVGKVFA